VTYIGKDLENYNQMCNSYIEFITEIYEKVENNSDDFDYLSQALPFLKSLNDVLQIFRGQFFSDPSLRPSNYNLVFMSQKEELFLFKYNKLLQKLQTKNGNY